MCVCLFAAQHGLFSAHAHHFFYPSFDYSFGVLFIRFAFDRHKHNKHTAAIRRKKESDRGGVEGEGERKGSKQNSFPCSARRLRYLLNMCALVSVMKMPLVASNVSKRWSLCVVAMILDIVDLVEMGTITHTHTHVHKFRN